MYQEASKVTATVIILGIMSCPWIDTLGFLVGAMYLLKSILLASTYETIDTGTSNARAVSRVLMTGGVL